MSDKRVRTGCITCRRRRIKCDEQKPTCLRCRSANFQCEGYAAPRRLSQSSPKSRTLISRHDSASRSSENSSASPESNEFPEISLRHKDWRREQLPLYHHFVTTTVVRIFRKDHVAFWRDDVVQMSHGMDLVYEALLAIGAVHRSSLIACQAGNGPESVRFKLLGFRAYGKVVRMLPSQLASNTIPDVIASLVVLMLLAYFECFLENPNAVFRHLWAAVLIFRSSEDRFSAEEMSHVVPIFDAMLRLDFLAQVIVPYAGPSFVRCSNAALMESPFWNRPDPIFSGATQIDMVAAEHHRLIQLVSAHNKLTGIVWACWSPVSEWTSRETMIGFYDEMSLWKATSPATFSPYDPSSEMGQYSDLNVNSSSLSATNGLPSDHTQTSSLSELQPYFFASNEAALNAAICNVYLASAAAVISTTDDDPLQRELEVFDLVYQNMRIAAGLIERHKYWANAQTPYKPCDAVSIGITTFLFQGAQRCFSRSWQKWTINALRKIGREGLSNGHTLANAIELLMLLESDIHNAHLSTDDAYLGAYSERLIPLMMPRGESDLHRAVYLRHCQTSCVESPSSLQPSSSFQSPSSLQSSEAGIEIVAKGSWRQEADGAMHSLKLEKNYVLSGETEQCMKSQKMDLFQSWRSEVENGWHGFLSKEVRDGILVKEGSPPLEF